MGRLENYQPKGTSPHCKYIGRWRWHRFRFIGNSTVREPRFKNANHWHIQWGRGQGAAVVGAPLQTLGRLRRKNVAGGFRPQTPAGAPPQTRLGAAAPRPQPQLEHSCGKAAPGLAPTPCIHDSIKPNFSESSLAGGL